MVEQHFPGCGWLRLPRDLMAELLAFRSRHALASWEATVRTLLDSAAAAPAPAKPAPLRLGAVLPRVTERTAP